MNDELTIVEVGLRDGLQNEVARIATEDKLRLLAALGAAGLRQVEVTSFVSPRAVPQLADAEAVLAGANRDARLQPSVLVINQAGFARARAAGAEAIAIVVVLTETLCQRNSRMSAADSLATAEDLVRRGRAEGVWTRAYLAPAWVCPFEGVVPRRLVIAAAERLADAGVDQLAIADTIGQAHPIEVGALFDELVVRIGAPRLAAHLHDTCALGLANAAAALRAGVRTIDAAVGGLGGCPFAPGAAGNLATEDLVLMATKMGLISGVDLAALWDAVELAGQLVGRPVGGRTATWWRQSRQERAA